MARLRFSILHRVLLVLLVMAALLGEVLIEMWRSERKRLEEVAREDATIHRRVLEQLWQVQSASLTDFVERASRSVSLPQPHFDRGSLINAEVDYVWLLDSQGRELAQTAREPELGVPGIEIDITQLAASQPPRHFFHRLENLVIEIAAVPIGNEGTWILAARLIDEEILSRMHDIARFQLGIAFEPPATDFSMERGGVVTLSFPLNGLENQPIAWLSGILTKTEFYDAAESQQKQWLALIFGNVLAFAVVAVLLWLWVGHPMNLLSESLTKEDPEGLKHLQASNSELGRFAKVLVEFYHDKTRLASEVAERKAAEVALREREELFRAVFDQSQQFIALLDRDGNLQSLNRAALAIVQTSDDQNVKIDSPHLWEKPLVAARALAQAMESARSGRPAEFELDLHRHGQPARFEFSLTPVYRDADSKALLFLLLTGHDLSAYRRMEAEVIRAGEEERGRIGLDLHDGLCQELTVVDLSLKLSGNKLARGDNAAAAIKLDEARKMLASSIASARDLARLLATVSLEENGLATSLHHLALNAQRMLDVHCEVVADEDIRCPELVAQHLYRISQEAIQNAVRHGKATRIDIALHQLENLLTLDITDNGSGIDDATLKAWNDSQIHGLRTMRYRMRLISGLLRVARNESTGLAIHCEVPLD